MNYFLNTEGTEDSVNSVNSVGGEKSAKNKAVFSEHVLFANKPFIC